MTSPAPITIGVDPGGRSTGIVAVDGRELLAARVVTRHAGNKIGDLGYGLDLWRRQTIDAIEELIAELAVDPRAVELNGARSCARTAIGAGHVRLAVEGIVAANPHHRTAGDIGGPSSAGILATAVVLGAILDHWPGRVTIVAPGGHGSHLAGSYPEPIRPVSAAGKDRNRHARSAYDVAIAAAFLGRIANAERVAADAAWPSTVTDAVTTHR